MAIPKPIANNFQTLLRAAKNGDLALMECTETTSGITRYVICGVGHIDQEIVMTPFGHVVDETMGNPFEFYTAPF